MLEKIDNTFTPLQGLSKEWMNNNDIHQSLKQMPNIWLGSHARFFTYISLVLKYPSKVWFPCKDEVIMVQIHQYPQNNLFSKRPSLRAGCLHLWSLEPKNQSLCYTISLVVRKKRIGGKKVKGGERGRGKRENTRGMERTKRKTTDTRTCHWVSQQIQQQYNGPSMCSYFGHEVQTGNISGKNFFQS